MSGSGGHRLGGALRALLSIAAAAIASAATAPGLAVADGPARWEKPVLTVQLAEPAAWAGTDVAAALAQWSPATPLVLVDDPPADVVLTIARERGAVEGATAYRDGEGSTITSCRVELAPEFAGADNTATLTHELGHCLGLHHNNGGKSSVMYWIQGAPHWSDTVTAADLEAVRQLHR